MTGTPQSRTRHVFSAQSGKWRVCVDKTCDNKGGVRRRCQKASKSVKRRQIRTQRKSGRPKIRRADTSAIRVPKLHCSCPYRIENKMMLWGLSFYGIHEYEYCKGTSRILLLIRMALEYCLNHQYSTVANIFDCCSYETTPCKLALPSKKYIPLEIESIGTSTCFSCCCHLYSHWAYVAWLQILVGSINYSYCTYTHTLLSQLQLDYWLPVASCVPCRLGPAMVC